MRRRYSDEISGLVRSEGRWSLIGGTTAHWTFDYPTYDPSVVSAAPEFRAGLLVVHPTDGRLFMKWAADAGLVESSDEIAAADEETLVDWLPVLVVDFDDESFVNSLYDLALEERAPSTWRRSFSPEQVELISPTVLVSRLSAR